MNKKNYYFKINQIFSLSLLLIILLFIFWGSYLFHLKKVNYHDSVNIDFENTYHVTESKVEIFKNICKITFKDDVIKSYADNPNANKYYSYILIEDYLRNHSEILMPLGASMAITNWADKFITTDGLISKDKYLEDFPVNKALLDSADEAGILADINPSYYTFIFSRKYIGADTIYCIINVEKNMLLPACDDSIVAIAHKNSDISFDSAKLTNAFLNLDKNSFWHDVQDDRIFIRSSEHIGGMLYLYETSKPKTHYYFLAMFLVLSVIFLIFHKKAVAWLSSLFYKPLHNTFDILGFSDNSGDIELLNQSVNNLIQSNQVLKTNLTQSNSDLRNLFIKNILYGVIPKNNLQSYDEKFGLSRFESDCLCIAIDCSNNSADGLFNHINDFNSTKNNNSDILEKFFADNFTGELIQLDNSKYIFITNEVSKVFLTNKLLTLLDIFKSLIDIYPFIAVGRAVDCVENIHKSFNDTVEILSRKFSYPESFLVFYDELPISKTTYYYPIELENNLIENILASKANNVHNIITELINTNLYQLSLNKENLSGFKFAITATIKRVIHMLNKSNTEVFGEEDIIYLDISHATNNEEIASNIRNIVNKLIEFIADNAKTCLGTLTSDILKWIEDNYNKDISLTDVAEHFCKSESHITRILNQHGGISFKEHLNKTRVKEAKRLLLSSDITTDKISQSIGFLNTRTFYRVFKQYTGYSPTEYRKISKKNAAEQDLY